MARPRGNRSEDPAAGNGASPAVAECSGPSCELVRPGPRAAVAVLAGEHDVSTLPLLCQVLTPLRLDSGLLVVIDVSRATFIDAAVLTALRGVEQAVTGRGGRGGAAGGGGARMVHVCVSAECGWGFSHAGGGDASAGTRCDADASPAR